MNAKPSPYSGKKRVLQLALLLLAVGVGWQLGSIFRGAPGDGGGGHAPQPAGQETIWTCSMHPQIRQPNPGLCPICAMDLIPLAEDGGAGDGAGARQLVVSDAAKALMEVETAVVERRFVESEVRLVGKVAHDETGLAYITAWVPGRIERMYADYTGTVVQKGDHMVDLFSPELINAKEELRRASEMLAKLPANAPEVLRNTAQSTLAAAQSRLKRWGMTEGQVQAAMRGTVSDRVTIYAPIGGTVIERNGQEGMYAETGERIYTIADLDRVWVMLEAYESDLSWLHFGQRVEFTTEAHPGQVLEGKIAFINPVLDERTRTVAVRVNADNRGRLLKPGMFVRATVRALVATGGRVMDPGLAGKWISPMHPEIVKDAPGQCDVCGMALVPAEELGYVSAQAKEEDKPLIIPATAPLITGRRAVVYVEVPGADRPTYEGREVTLGPRAGSYYMVVSGLQEGERVVVQGNFKIDSALEIQAKPSMMGMEGGGFALEPPDSELQRHLRDLFGVYAELSETLAHDNAEAANAALGKLRGAPAFSETPHKALDTLHRAVESAVDSDGIDEMRIAFAHISNAYVRLVKAHGMAAGGAVYRLHCPMVGEGLGDWLQPDDAIRNPYMGARMFQCGTVEELLVEGTEDGGDPEAPAYGAEGHRHE